jgi:hypothetical protein
MVPQSPTARCGKIASPFQESGGHTAVNPAQSAEERQTGKTMQEPTDEKRKELDTTVENGGDENIKIRPTTSCRKPLRLVPRTPLGFATARRDTAFRA